MAREPPIKKGEKRGSRDCLLKRRSGGITKISSPTLNNRHDASKTSHNPEKSQSPKTVNRHRMAYSPSSPHSSPRILEEMTLNEIHFGPPKTRKNDDIGQLFSDLDSSNDDDDDGSLSISDNEEEVPNSQDFFGNCIDIDESSDCHISSMDSMLIDEPQHVSLTSKSPSGNDDVGVLRKRMSPVTTSLVDSELEKTVLSSPPPSSPPPSSPSPSSPPPRPSSSPSSSKSQKTVRNKRTVSQEVNVNKPKKVKTNNNNNNKNDTTTTPTNTNTNAVDFEALPIQEAVVTIGELKELRIRGQIVRQINLAHIKSLSKVPLSDLFAIENPRPIFISSTSLLHERCIAIEGNHRLSVLSQHKVIDSKMVNHRVHIGIIVIEEDEFDTVYEKSYHVDFKIIKMRKDWNPIIGSFSVSLKMAVIGIVTKEARRCSSEISRYDEAVFYNSLLGDFIGEHEKNALRIGSGHARTKKLNELVKREIIHPPTNKSRSSMEIIWIFLMGPKTQSVFMSGLHTDSWPSADNFFRCIYEASLADDALTEECLEKQLKVKSNCVIFRNKLVSIAKKTGVKNSDDSTLVAKGVRSTIIISKLEDAEDGSFLFFIDDILNVDIEVAKNKRLSIICVTPTNESAEMLLQLRGTVLGGGIVHNKLVDSSNGRGKFYLLAGEAVTVRKSGKTFESLASLVKHHTGFTPNKFTRNYEPKIFEISNAN